MLVLTRAVGQKIVINGDITATVSAIGRDYCDMQISHCDGRPIGVVTLRHGMNRRELAHGVWGYLARVEPHGKIRLAFEIPNGITVVRDS